MNSRTGLFLTLALLLATAPAGAEECVVSDAAGLAGAITGIAARGDCATDSAAYRERYENFRGTSVVFHVLHFTNSADIGISMPCMTGFHNNPLVIVADPTLIVNFSGLDPACVTGAGGAVILDHIIFKSGIEISGSGSAVIGSEIKGAAKISGDSNTVFETEISGSLGHGIEISGDKNKISKSKIHDNVKNGVFVTGAGTKITDSEIFSNGRNGVYVSTCGGKENCENPVAALVSRTEFSANGDKAIAAERWQLPAPKDIVSVSTGAEWKVSGILSLPAEADSPWKPFNIKAAKAELFLENGKFVAETEEIDATTGRFVFTVSKKDYPSPVFVAAAVDYENNNTSALSEPADAVKQDDFDGDGLANNAEDYNHNGIVDFGETDPRKYDTDGDGLSDGEERLHAGRVKKLMEKIAFADLPALDPVNPDSDGDCLSDGLELGVMSGGDSAGAVAVISALAGGKTASTPPVAMTPFCKAVAKKHAVEEFAAFDADPATVTDPTNADTDRDGMKDGEEDWNFNGRIEDGETGPNNADTDGDTLLDGAEGDRNGSEELENNETDPLLQDTDGDGVADGTEFRLGSLPNACDSDADGLADGIEAGKINPNAKNPKCAGLQIAGTNFVSIGVLSPVKTDSDGDGLADGKEDLNGNGWLDMGETDPTTADTDGDGFLDYVEKTLDTDHDGVPNVDLNLLENGKKCSPPENADDTDCDGVPNARDDDSDDDGCLDEKEKNDKNADGVPDVWQQKAASCSAGNGGGAAESAAPPASSGSAPAASGAASAFSPAKNTGESTGGANCTLNKNARFPDSPLTGIFLAAIFLCAGLRISRIFKNFS